MAKILSEEALKEVSEHIRKERSDRRNKPLRHTPDETDPQTPEVYIAKAQSAGGIPALTVGAGGDPDEPGTDTADIYKINSDGELEAVNFDVIVYNLTSSIIPDTAWTTVHRSKYGLWLILPADVGGAFIAKPQSASGIPAITRGTPDVAGSDTCDIYQLNDDDEIVAVTSREEEVFNITDEIIPQDWILVVKTNFGKWIAVSGGAAGIKFGKVQSHVNNTGATNRTVSVKACDYDGGNVVGDAFNIVTPIAPNQDTALFTDYIVGYLGSDKVIVTPCMDDPIGTIREVNADAAIRDGWRLCDGAATSDLRGKFTVGFDTADADYNAIGDTGGNADHGADTNDHNDHSNFTHSHSAVCSGVADTNGDGTTAEFWLYTSPGDSATLDATDSRDLGHTTTDNRPPFFTVKKIERFE